MKVLVLLAFVSLVYCQGGVRVLNQKDLCLSSHNNYRQQHVNTPNLIWDDQLARGAEEYAKKLARAGNLKHSSGNYGENLYMAGGFTPDHSDACQKASDSWYDEIKLYDFNRPGYRRGVGHFTQMVWKSSTRLGVGVAQIGRTVVVVARYTPRGNNLRSFADNVMRKTDGTTGTGGSKTTRKPLVTSSPSNCFDRNPRFCWQKDKCRTQRWAMEKYCRKYCGYCSSTGGGGVVTNSPPQTRAPPPTSGTACYDKKPLFCYRKDWCQTKQLIMKSICAKFCGFCKGTGTGGTGTGGTGTGGTGTGGTGTGGVKVLNQKDLCLSSHNNYRQKHRDTPNLIWDDQLARGAEEYAKKLVRAGNLKHSSGNYGENLYMAGGFTPDHSDACQKASDSWYDEIKLYDFNRPGYRRGVGHFTQMVWKSSTRLGVGVAQIGRTVVVVARYTPAGNFRGRFGSNVMNLK